jgi:hemolysin III
MAQVVPTPDQHAHVHRAVRAVVWLLGGGVAYLVGAGFFVFDTSLRFGHFIWHLFALAGSSCHVCAALWPTLG